MPGKLHSIERSIVGAGIAAFWMLAPASVAAQSQDAAPCCGIVRIDAAKSVVTARDMATGYTFRVEIRSKKLLSTLKVGDKVWANFAAKRVRLGAAGDSLCCALLDTAAATPRTTTNP